MEKREILHYVDHTLLTQTATWQELQALCDEAIAFETASVCIPPARVAEVKRYVENRMAVCTVIGFPNGYHSTAVKAFETEDALQNGADEIDMVVNLGLVREKKYREVLEEIRLLKNICGDRILKVIVETCLLTEEEKIRMCELVTDAGANFIKTSTGFAGGGATFADVALFAKYIGPDVKVKAAGGIADFEDARKFIELGASRLGTSRLIRLAR